MFPAYSSSPPLRKIRYRSLSERCEVSVLKKQNSKRKHEEQGVGG